MLPTTYPITVRSMNYALPVVLLFYLLCWLNWELYARHDFAGPMRASTTPVGSDMSEESDDDDAVFIETSNDDVETSNDNIDGDSRNGYSGVIVFNGSNGSEFENGIKNENESESGHVLNENQLRVGTEKDRREQENESRSGTRVQIGQRGEDSDIADRISIDRGSSAGDSDVGGSAFGDSIVGNNTTLVEMTDYVTAVDVTDVGLTDVEPRRKKLNNEASEVAGDM